MVILTPADYNLGLKQRLAYGGGYMLVDLFCATWFSYTLLYFDYVVGFTSSMTGYLPLFAQVLDTIGTPVAGFIMDKTKGCSCYPNHKTWHLCGSVILAIGFPFLFSPSLLHRDADQWWHFGYYIGIEAFVITGLLITQVAHFSLLPHLTMNKSEQTELNSIRYGFTVISYMALHIFTLLIIEINKRGEEVSHQLSPKDASTFQSLILTLTGIGILFTIIFHVVVKEPRAASITNTPEIIQKEMTVDESQPSGDRRSSIHKATPEHRRPSVAELEMTRGFPKNQSAPENEISVCTCMTWKKWLKEYQFYQINGLFLCARLILTLSQSYFPFYITNTLAMNKRYIAILPLVVDVSGLVAAIIMRPITACIGLKATFVMGALVTIGAAAWFYFIQATDAFMVFGPTALIGFGTSAMFITSVAIISHLIGRHAGTSGFVFGAMILTPKLVDGVVVLILQSFRPCSGDVCCAACMEFYRGIMSIGLGSVSCLALVVTATLLPVTIGQLRQHGKVADIAAAH